MISEYFLSIKLKVYLIIQKTPLSHTNRAQYVIRSNIQGNLNTLLANQTNCQVFFTCLVQLFSNKES